MHRSVPGSSKSLTLCKGSWRHIRLQQYSSDSRRGDVFRFFHGRMRHRLDYTHTKSSLHTLLVTDNRSKRVIRDNSLLHQSTHPFWAHTLLRVSDVVSLRRAAFGYSHECCTSGRPFHGMTRVDDACLTIIEGRYPQTRKRQKFVLHPAHASLAFIFGQRHQLCVCTRYGSEDTNQRFGRER